LKSSLVSQIEHESQNPDFWSDNRAAKQKQSRMASAKQDLADWKRLESAMGDIQASAEILESEEDASLRAELDLAKAALGKTLAELDFHRMLSGPYDRKNALLNVHPGAGGTESQDWAEMLVRMYSRWAERKGFKLELLDYQAGDEAGIKNVTLRIEGEWAFGLLRSEKGVHRLVRISPFDSNARRQTSFASVEPFPELDEDVELEIDEKDLKIDVFRASGAGGQHVNRTESAVRITHLPSGIVVTCQNDRSQVKNKASAMSVLKSRLYTRAQEEKRQKMEGIAGEKKDINFGSQVRSYVLHPYQQIKDHRTDIDYSRVQDILDGDLDSLIEDCLRKESLEAVKAHA
jgi:peptide chain release factor 2